MNYKLIAAFALSFLFLCNIGSAQKIITDIPYVENGHERQVCFASVESGEILHLS
jgi:hypothetical protein